MPQSKTWAMTACLILLFGFPLSAAPQCCGPMIVGRVSDTEGAVIPNAKVVIINLSTGHSTKVVTNNLGEYKAPPLPLGQYKVRVNARGFKTSETPAQTLEIDKVLHFDVILISKKPATKQ